MLYLLFSKVYIRDIVEVIKGFGLPGVRPFVDYK